MEIWFSVGPKGAEDFVAEGEEGIEFEEFWGRNEIKRPLLSYSTMERKAW